MASACSCCHPGPASVVTQGRSIPRMWQLGTGGFAGVAAAQRWRERCDPLPDTWGACGHHDSCCLVTSCHTTPLCRSGEGARLCPPL